MWQLAWLAKLNVPYSLYTANPSGTAMAFQMNSPATTGTGACQAVAIAVGKHANSIEFWLKTGGLPGFTGEDPATLKAWSQDLLLGTPPTC